MTELKIRTPDGRTGTITYENEADKQMKMARAKELHPGIEFFEAPPVVFEDTAPDGPVQRLTTLATGIGKGVTFDWADELAAGVATGAKELFMDPELLASAERGGVDQSYEAEVERQRARMAELEQESPWLMGGGELIGGFAVPGIGAFKGGQALSQAITRLTPMGGLALTGGAAGALAGAGASEEETTAGVAQDALLGGGIGAVAAPLVGAAAAKAGDIGGALAMGLARRFASDPETAALMRVRQSLEADDISTADEAQAVLDDLGDTGVLADLGPNIREEAVLVGKQPGPGRRMAEEFVEERQMGQQDRLNEVARQTLDSDRFGTWGSDYYRFMDDLATGRKEQARPLYEQAYEQTIRPTEEMVRISKTDAFQEAAKRAMGNMRNKLDTFGPAQPPTTNTGMVSTQFMDQILRELRDEANAAFRSGRGEYGADVNNIFKALRSEIYEQNPTLRQARGVWAGSKQLEEAADAGRGLLSGKKQYAEDVERLLADMSEGEQDAFSIGLVRGIMDRLADASETADAGRRLFNSRRVRDLLKEAFQDENAFQRFWNAARQESQYQMTRNRVIGGSPTAQLLFQEGQGKVEVPESSVGIVSAILRRAFNETVADPDLGPQDYERMAEFLFGDVDQATLQRIFGTAFKNRFPGSAGERAVPAAIGVLSGQGAAEFSSELDWYDAVD